MPNKNCTITTAREWQTQSDKENLNKNIRIIIQDTVSPPRSEERKKNRSVGTGALEPGRMPRTTYLAIVRIAPWFEYRQNEGVGREYQKRSELDDLDTDKSNPAAK